MAAAGCADICIFQLSLCQLSMTFWCGTGYCLLQKIKMFLLMLVINFIVIFFIGCVYIDCATLCQHWRVSVCYAPVLCKNGSHAGSERKVTFSQFGQITLTRKWYKIHAQFILKLNRKSCTQNGHVADDLEWPLGH